MAGLIAARDPGSLLPARRDCGSIQEPLLGTELVLGGKTGEQTEDTGAGQGLILLHVHVLFPLRPRQGLLSSPGCHALVNAVRFRDDH